MRHIHLIGIGGTGLSAIARVLLERDYTVSGSDSVASPLFKAIAEAGAVTFLGHAADQIAGADLVIRSSAIPDSNPEVIAAEAAGIPVVKRADFLQELTQDKETLAVAGSHGKTTTTAMLIWILEALKTHPSFIAGGMVNQLGCNARAGSGPYFAIEADEYDYMFLGLSPKIAVITNIEHDHPDCFPTESDYQSAFKQFLNRVRPDGAALICRDDPQASALMDEMTGEGIQMIGYGLSKGAEYRADKISIVGGFPRFTLYDQRQSAENCALGTVQLSVPGQHNVLNATAVLGVIHQLGLPLGKAINALQNFTGAGRRFEIIGKVNNIIIVDDYGHHPTEIAATLEAARSRYSSGRFWAIWQPHTYTRTQLYEAAFVKALSKADRVVIMKIYAAREADPGYSAERIAETLSEDKAVYLPDSSILKSFLKDNLRPGDVAIFFSAGDATEISQAVFQSLQETNRNQTGKSDE